MANLYVGIGQMSLMMRHARSLKDKRQILKSIEQKLRNRGFSVAECDYADNPKQSVIGYSVVGHHAPAVEKLLDEAEQLFVGEATVIRTERDLFDYSESEHEQEFETWDDPKEDP